MMTRAMRLFGAGAREQVAVDDSPSFIDEARGDVYVASDGGASPVHPNGGVRRVDARGEIAVPFTCAEGIADKYINESGELVGKPGELWSSEDHSPIRGVAVDSGSGGPGVVPGEVYVLNQTEFGARGGG